MRPRSLARLDGSGTWDRLSAGLRQGDGVFETLRTYHGRPFRLRDHLERLRAGARALGLRGVPPMTRLRAATEVALRLARRSGRDREWVVRPAIWAGRTSTEFAVSVELLVRGGAPGSGPPLRVGVGGYAHPGESLVPPGSTGPVKWLARGPLAHSLRLARSRGWSEALLRDGRGRYIEGTRSNLLVIRGRTLLSPGPESRALDGITRRLALGSARARGLRIEERPVRPRELAGADEVILTSSLLEVAPVELVQDVWEARGPCPGPVTEGLREDFARTVARETGSTRSRGRHRVARGPREQRPVWTPAAPDNVR